MGISHLFAHTTINAIVSTSTNLNPLYFRPKRNKALFIAVKL